MLVNPAPSAHAASTARGSWDSTKQGLMQTLACSGGRAHGHTARLRAEPGAGGLDVPGGGDAMGARARTAEGARWCVDVLL